VGATAAELYMAQMLRMGAALRSLHGCVARSLSSFALYSVTYFVMHALNFTQTHGAALQNILTAGQMVGQPLWGLALDRGGRTNMTMLCYILCGILTLAIGLPSKSIGVLIFFAVVQGLKGGTIWLASPPIVGSVVGRTSKSPYPSSGWSWPFRHW
jgi:MFS family permease